MVLKRSLDILNRMVRVSFAKLIPSLYYQDPDVKRSIYIWLLIGLLIRLTFMPITLHFDLLSIYQRSALIAYGGDLGIGFGQLFAHYIHAFSLLIFKPFMPYIESILPGMTGSANWVTWRLFTIHPNVFRTLFLFKIPYLVFDLGCALLLLAIFQDNQDRKKGLTAFKFWMINPVVIFSAFIFSRYEPIVIFFILLSLYYAKNNLSVRALFSLGVAVIVRSYPLMLVPFFVIIIGKTFWERLKLAFWGLLPLLVVTVLSRAFQGISEAEVWARMHHSTYLMVLRWSMSYKYDVIFVFFMGYTIILLYTYFRTNHSFTDLWKNNLILLLFFYATCFFHPHYFMWLIPFLTFWIVKDKRFIGLFAIQIVCWIVYSFQWKAVLAGYLFAPFNYSYFTSLLSPFEIVDKYYPAGNFIKIFRSIFSGVSLWMIYMLLRESFLISGKEKG